MLHSIALRIEKSRSRPQKTSCKITRLDCMLSLLFNNMGSDKLALGFRGRGGNLSTVATATAASGAAGKKPPPLPYPLVQSWSWIQIREILLFKNMLIIRYNMNILLWISSACVVVEILIISSKAWFYFWWHLQRACPMASSSCPPQPLHQRAGCDGVALKNGSNQKG